MYLYWYATPCRTLYKPCNQNHPNEDSTTPTSNQIDSNRYP
jgi:hypothetical protein